MNNWLSGKIAWKKMWNPALYSLGIEADLETFEAGQFVRVALERDGERVGRPYSLVNPPQTRPLEIFFNVVPEGPLSPELGRLEAGDDILLHPSANGFLTLSEIPAETRDLWMFATGTGVGPFLSILRTTGPWERFERVVLAYGTRRVADLAYRRELAALGRAHPGRFTFIPLVTGEHCPAALRCRITEALENGLMEAHAGFDLDPRHSHLMLCGRQDMISEVSDLLEPRGFRRHRRREPGQISVEKYH